MLRSALVYFQRCQPLLSWLPETGIRNMEEPDTIKTTKEILNHHRTRCNKAVAKLMRRLRSIS